MTSTPAPGMVDHRRQVLLGIGLVLLLAGLFLAAGSIPDNSGNLPNYLGLVGGALLCVWIGGVVMGRASGRRPTPPVGG